VQSPQLLLDLDPWGLKKCCWWSLIRNGRQGTADLKLFHDRVEHVLGLRPDWVSCGEVKGPGKVLELFDRNGISDVGPIRS